MLMAGLEKPTSGSIRFQEKELTSYTEDHSRSRKKYWNCFPIILFTLVIQH